mgnify:CR=1 FL=1
MAMSVTQQIKEHMMVHALGEGSMNGVAGVHIGTVDYVDGDQIILTKNDSPDGQHHAIPVSMVDRVENNTVFLNADAEMVRGQWRTVQPDMSRDRGMGR